MKFEQALHTAEKQILTEMAYGYSVNASKITRAQLVDLLKNLQGKDVAVKFTSVVDATYKKNNPLGKIFKVSQVDGLLNANYAEKKQEKIDTHQPGQTYVPGKTYGTHVAPSVIENIDKKTGAKKFYIQVLPTGSASQRFFVQTNIGSLVEKPKADVQPYIAPSRPPGITDVVIRRYGLDSVVAIEIDNKSYEIMDVEAERQSVLSMINAGVSPSASKFPRKSQTAANSSTSHLSGS